MNNNIIKNIIMGIVFVVSVVLVFVGQKNIGYEGLATQMIGVVGLIALLYSYNRRYK